MYLDRVRDSDDVARKLFEGLVLAGLDKQTLFVVVGDHGVSLQELEPR